MGGRKIVRKRNAGSRRFVGNGPFNRLVIINFTRNVPPFYERRIFFPAAASSLPAPRGKVAGVTKPTEARPAGAASAVMEYRVVMGICGGGTPMPAGHPENVIFFL